MSNEAIISSQEKDGKAGVKKELLSDQRHVRIIREDKKFFIVSIAKVLVQ